MSRLRYTKGANKGMTLGQVQDPRMMALIQMNAPKTASLMKAAEKFKEEVLFKWDFYRKNYGYKKTKESAKAAAGPISNELLKSFSAEVGNTPDAVYKIIAPFEINLPWWLDWKLLAAGAAAVYFGPGVIGRYRRGRN